MDTNITLTPALRIQLKRILAPLVKYGEDGEIDTEANAASAIFHQMLVLKDCDLPNIWVSVYHVETAWGGPEEGGWTYENMTLVSSTGCSSTSDVLKTWGEIGLEILGDFTEPEEAAEILQLEEATVKECLERKGQVRFPSVTLEGGDGYRYQLCLESVRGYQRTWRKPIYC